MSPQQLPQDKKWLALALLALAQFVVVLDASIVNVALPSIGRDLQFSQDDLSWVVNGYTLFFGGFLLLGGRMADLIGRRRLFVAGLILFALASLAGGLATSSGMLIAARAVQGLGAAMLSPAALSLVTVIFAEGAERNKALGVWGAVAGSGGAAGVLLGGVLTEYAGWEGVLFVNVPIGIAAAILAPRLLPESRNAGTRHFDVAGAVSVTTGLSALVTRFGFKPILVAGLVLTAIGLVWFSQVEVGGSYVGDILFPSLIAAVGLGFAFVPMTIAAVSGVEAHEAGLASGLINTSQQVGGALGLAILATIANGRTADVAEAGNPLPV